MAQLGLNCSCTGFPALTLIDLQNSLSLAAGDLASGTCIQVPTNSHRYTHKSLEMA